MSAPRILVVGSCMMDLVAQVERAPECGETVLGAGFLATPGGKGLNQAVAAARMGARVRLASRVGGDAFGSELLAVCDAEGVDRAHVGADPDAGTGVSLIVVDAGGDNRIVANPRANATLAPEHAEVAFAGGPPPDALLMCRETPDAPLVRAAELARAAGVPVVFNAAPAGPPAPGILALTDVVVVNESEAAALAGVAPRDADSALAAARALVALGPPAAVVTLGSAGAVYAGPDGEGAVPPFASDAVDSTGAGDAFCGALAVGVCAGLALADAVRLGNAAGALAVRGMGAASSLPRRADVLALAGPLPV